MSNIGNMNCEQLSQLRTRILSELNALKQGEQQEEREGIQNPIEMLRVIKSLQEVLNTINVELEKCP